MSLDQLPLTYDECRARFRRAAGAAGLDVEHHAIAAVGPEGQRLSVDVVAVGAPAPRRALLLMSGVHGVEGFFGSLLQTEFLRRLDRTQLPPDVAIVVVHGVNPWGMAWWRRQNESNVDLNRNFRRSEVTPVPNEAYDELHPYACPDTETLPDPAELVSAAAALVETRGLEFVRDGITVGQYRHPDGLHFGGDRTEESSRIIEAVVGQHLTGVERLLTIDLHTGHGPRGVATFLSDAPIGSPQDQFLREHFGADRVEATADNPAATTGAKSGQIGNGIAQLLGEATCFASAFELGTATDMEQLLATCREQWVYRHGDRNDPEHAAAIWDYRCCFAPDDSEWVASAVALGGALIDAAVDAVTTWTG